MLCCVSCCDVFKNERKRCRLYQMVFAIHGEVPALVFPIHGEVPALVFPIHGEVPAAGGGWGWDSSQRRTFSSSSTSVKVLPSLRSEASVAAKRLRNRCPATRRASSGFTFRLRARETIANRRSP